MNSSSKSNSRSSTFALFATVAAARFLRVGALALLVCATLPALAVNRCKDAQGNVTFSDTACPNAAEGGKIDIKPATGGGANAGGHTYTPPKPPATLAGKQARLAALDDAISSLTRQMEKDSLEGAAALDKVYKEMAAASKALSRSTFSMADSRLVRSLFCLIYVYYIYIER